MLFIPEKLKIVRVKPFIIFDYDARIKIFRESQHRKFQPGRLYPKFSLAFEEYEVDNRILNFWKNPQPLYITPVRRSLEDGRCIFCESYILGDDINLHLSYRVRVTYSSADDICFEELQDWVQEHRNTQEMNNKPLITVDPDLSSFYANDFLTF